MITRIQKLQEYGQSVWYDNISRDLINNGSFNKLIEIGVVGLTSNPTIFEKAIGAGSAYDDQIRELVKGDKNAEEIFTELAIQDIRNVADLFRPIYEKTNGTDGFVSIEVSPLLAHDQEATLVEARRFYEILARPNIMIKVPATPEGVPAVEALIGEGINVNVTLIFSLQAYQDVARAYIRGLQKLAASGKKPLDRVASVASFFVSRVDVLVDDLLEKKIAATDDAAEKAELESLLGKSAIANSKLAYEKFKEIFSEAEFEELRQKNAHPQRVLWASTSTKNPKYRDILYAEELVGPETVDTMPPQTVDAFNDHGEVASTLDIGYQEAHQIIARLGKVGISIDQVTDQLLAEGVEKFADSFNQLLAGVEKKRQKLVDELQQVGKL
ncbi:MAG: transaldolase [Chloroflexota bacterium]|nr:transaldolase [Chloroflexota bacterium]